jgi:hypothetical protein
MDRAGVTALREIELGIFTRLKNQLNDIVNLLNGLVDWMVI